VQILSDNTVDTAAVLLDAHTPQVGSAWTKNGTSTATMVISSANRIRQSGTGLAGYYIGNVPAGPDQTIVCDDYIAAIGAAAQVAGPTLRMDTAANTLYEAGYRGNSLAWSIIKIVAGKITLLAGVATTVTAGATYTLTFSIVGSSLILLVNGVSTVTATDSTITATGRVGIHSGITTTDTTGHHQTNLSADDGAMQPNEYQTRQNFTVYRM